MRAPEASTTFFQCANSAGKPAAKLAGAGFLYCSCKEPQATASVFVYPAGRVGQSQ